jgi:uroporphyrinogen-III decarboxylase
MAGDARVSEGGRIMTGRERLLAAMRGEPVDRAPIWLREGFELYQPPPPQDDFRNGWKHDRTFRELCEYVEPYIDYFVPWNIGAVNRFLMVPPRAIARTGERLQGDTLVSEGYIDAGKRKLAFRTEWKRHNNNGWMTLHPVQTIEDLKAVAAIPFELDTGAIDAALPSYGDAVRKAGERGLPLFGISSPIVIISGLMDLQLFLELSYTHKALFHELLELITGRLSAVLRYALSKGPFDTAMNIGGSEQCTPPLMAPESYDEYVVPYETPFIEECHRHGIPVNIHCHGKIRHALKCMADMGVDSTDPVEPPPAGNLDFHEAREISRGSVTLRGNLEYNEFTHLTPDQMKTRVKSLFADGNRRMILAASAGPNTYISPRIADNYRALVDTALEYGG